MIEGGGNASGGERPRGSGLTAALAEFSALRAEITGSQGAQYAFVGVALTSIGLTWSFAIKEPAREELLVAVAPIAFVAELLYLSLVHRMVEIGDYIRAQLWPYIQGATDYEESWERYTSEHLMKWTFSRAIKGLFFDGSVTLILAGSAWSPFLYGLRSATPKSYGIALSCAILTALVPATYGILQVMRHRVKRS